MILKITYPTSISSFFCIWAVNISDLYPFCRQFNSLRNQITVYSNTDLYLKYMENGYTQEETKYNPNKYLN